MDIEVKIYVDKGILLKHNYCRDAKTEYIRDNIKTFEDFIDYGFIVPNRFHPKGNIHDKTCTTRQDKENIRTLDQKHNTLHRKDESGAVLSCKDTRTNHTEASNKTCDIFNTTYIKATNEKDTAIRTHSVSSNIHNSLTGDETLEEHQLLEVKEQHEDIADDMTSDYEGSLSGIASDDDIREEAMEPNKYQHSYKSTENLKQRKQEQEKTTERTNSIPVAIKSPTYGNKEYSKRKSTRDQDQDKRKSNKINQNGKNTNKKTSLKVFDEKKDTKTNEQSKSLKLEKKEKSAKTTHDGRFAKQIQCVDDNEKPKEETSTERNLFESFIQEKCSGKMNTVSVCGMQDDNKQTEHKIKNIGTNISADTDSCVSKTAEFTSFSEGLSSTKKAVHIMSTEVETVKELVNLNVKQSRDTQHNEATNDKEHIMNRQPIGCNHETNADDASLKHNDVIESVNDKSVKTDTLQTQIIDIVSSMKKVTERLFHGKKCLDGVNGPVESQQNIETELEVISDDDNIPNNCNDTIGEKSNETYFIGLDKKFDEVIKANTASMDLPVVDHRADLDSTNIMHLSNEKPLKMKQKRDKKVTTFLEDILAKRRHRCKVNAEREASNSCSTPISQTNGYIKDNVEEGKDGNNETKVVSDEDQHQLQENRNAFQRQWSKDRSTRAIAILNKSPIKRNQDTSQVISKVTTENNKDSKHCQSLQTDQVTKTTNGKMTITRGKNTPRKQRKRSAVSFRIKSSKDKQLRSTVNGLSKQDSPNCKGVILAKNLSEIFETTVSPQKTKTMPQSTIRKCVQEERTQEPAEILDRLKTIDSLLSTEKTTSLTTEQTEGQNISTGDPHDMQKFSLLQRSTESVLSDSVKDISVDTTSDSYFMKLNRHENKTKVSLLVTLEEQDLSPEDENLVKTSLPAILGDKDDDGTLSLSITNKNTDTKTGIETTETHNDELCKFVNDNNLVDQGMNEVNCEMTRLNGRKTSEKSKEEKNGIKSVTSFNDKGAKASVNLVNETCTEMIKCKTLDQVIQLKTASFETTVPIEKLSLKIEKEKSPKTYQELIKISDDQFVKRLKSLGNSDNEIKVSSKVPQCTKDIKNDLVIKENKTNCCSVQNIGNQQIHPIKGIKQPLLETPKLTKIPLLETPGSMDYNYSTDPQISRKSMKFIQERRPVNNSWVRKSSVMKLPNSLPWDHHIFKSRKGKGKKSIKNLNGNLRTQTSITNQDDQSFQRNKKQQSIVNSSAKEVEKEAPFLNGNQKRKIHVTDSTVTITSYKKKRKQNEVTENISIKRNLIDMDKNKNIDISPKKKTVAKDKNEDINISPKRNITDIPKESKSGTKKEHAKHDYVPARKDEMNEHERRRDSDRGVGYSKRRTTKSNRSEDKKRTYSSSLDKSASGTPSLASVVVRPVSVVKSREDNHSKPRHGHEKCFNAIKEIALHFYNTFYDKKWHLARTTNEEFSQNLKLQLKRNFDRYLYDINDPIYSNMGPQPRFVSEDIMSSVIRETIKNPHTTANDERLFREFEEIIGYVGFNIPCYWCEVDFRYGQFFRALPVLDPIGYRNDTMYCQ